MTSLLQVHPADDLIVALRDLEAGTEVSLNGHRWTLREAIAAKHKFAAKDFALGDLVTMYGVTVGKATQPIAAGALVHTHNIVHATAAFSGKQRDYVWTPPDVSKWAGRSFLGFKRSQGPAGTANHWIATPGSSSSSQAVSSSRPALASAVGSPARSAGTSAIPAS